MPLPVTLVIQRVILLVIPDSSFVQLNQGGRLSFGRFSAMFDKLQFVAGLQHRLRVERRQTIQFVTCLTPSPSGRGLGTDGVMLSIVNFIRAFLKFVGRFLVVT